MSPMCITKSGALEEVSSAAIRRVPIALMTCLRVAQVCYDTRCVAATYNTQKCTRGAVRQKKKLSLQSNQTRVQSDSDRRGLRLRTAYTWNSIQFGVIGDELG
jgi:hypothetical protein